MRYNQYINAPQVRVLDEKGEMLGVMSSKEALVKAEEAGLDLVEISAGAVPPVCKIIDFGKYNYQ
ncbi:MAG: translation initiation factor IF-3, partial [Spirochaetia bacterium]|nr:translation initiation factor IF-3 [Spirochaetia bacterium]